MMTEPEHYYYDAITTTTAPGIEPDDERYWLDAYKLETRTKTLCRRTGSKERSPRADVWTEINGLQVNVLYGPKPADRMLPELDDRRFRIAEAQKAEPVINFEKKAPMTPTEEDMLNDVLYLNKPFTGFDLAKGGGHHVFSCGNMDPLVTRHRSELEAMVQERILAKKQREHCTAMLQQKEALEKISETPQVRKYLNDLMVDWQNVFMGIPSDGCILDTRTEAQKADAAERVHDGVFREPPKDEPEPSTKLFPAHYYLGWKGD